VFFVSENAVLSNWFKSNGLPIPIVATGIQAVAPKPELNDNVTYGELLHNESVNPQNGPW